MNKLKEIIADCDELIIRIKNFYKLHQTRWFKDYKPHGFDVQDIRMGGLQRRIESCIERLEKYLSGEIEKIEELEEEILNEFEEKYSYFNTYARNSTVNVFAH